MAQSTHDLRFAGDVVEKHYRSWSRDEPDREWACLCLLDRLRPGLAPRPVERRTENGAPVIVMSRLPGIPLGDEPLDEVQTTALVETLRSLYAVSGALLDGLPPRIPPRNWGPGEMVPRVADWAAGIDPGTLDSQVATALVEGRGWLASAEGSLAAGNSVACLTNGDGNLGNYLWDGQRCRVVDFEDGGISDLAFEVADLVEHLSASLTGHLDAGRLFALLDLGLSERQRVGEARRFFALYWLLMLLPGNPAHARNPIGSLERQAERLRALLDHDS